MQHVSLHQNIWYFYRQNGNGQVNEKQKTTNTQRTQTKKKHASQIYFQ